MRPILKIFVYLAVVVLGGAFLAPPLWAAGQWAIQTDVLPALRPFAFAKYFNRAVLVLALGFLLPWLRWLGLRRWRDLGLRRNPYRWRQLVLGFVLGCGGASVLAGVACAAGWLVWRGGPNLAQVLGAAATAAAVALVEELFFRGALFGALRRALPWPVALAFLTGLFALLHFIGPEPGWSLGTEVDAWSGLRLLPHLLWQFGEPSRIFGTLLTLAVMGFLLGLTVVRTGSLHAAVGLHAGWVFALRLVSWQTRRGAAGPWLGDDLRAGVAPLCLMLVTCAVVGCALRPARVASSIG